MKAQLRKCAVLLCVIVLSAVSEAIVSIAFHVRHVSQTNMGPVRLVSPGVSVFNFPKDKIGDMPCNGGRNFRLR